VQLERIPLRYLFTILQSKISHSWYVSRSSDFLRQAFGQRAHLSWHLQSWSNLAIIFNSLKFKTGQ
jgi:hypothetical protein